MQITLEWLEERDACPTGIEYYEKLGTTDLETLLRCCIKDHAFSYFGWGIRHVFTKQEALQFNLACVENIPIPECLATEAIVTFTLVKEMLANPSFSIERKAKYFYEIYSKARFTEYELYIFQGFLIDLLFIVSRYCSNPLNGFSIDTPIGFRTAISREAHLEVQLNTAIKIIRAKEVA